MFRLIGFRASLPVLSMLAFAAALIIVPSDAFAAGDNSHRYPYHATSLLGLAILAASLLTAAWLNHATPGRRVVGTFLAAAMTLGVGLIIWWLHFLGSLDATKPGVFPTDGLKPDFMRLLGVAFVVMGLFLLLVTYWQTKRADVLTLARENEDGRYGRRTRVLHWTTAILFILLVPMGVYMSMMPEDVWYRQGYYLVHKSLGFTVLILVAVRLVWHRMSATPALDGSLKGWEKRLAHGAHILLYVMMIGFPITGYILSSYAGKLSHFFFWDLPLFWEADSDAIIPWALLHKLVLPVLFYVVIAAHIAGALKHQFIDKHDNAFKRMVT